MAEELLQRLLAATDPAEKAALVAYSIIERENPLLVKLIPVLAFLRWFGEPVVAALLLEAEREHSAKLFASLIELPFVERVTYGYALHDLTRRGLLADATTEQRLNAAQAATAYAMSDDEGRLVEVLYCTALGEESEAARQLLENQIERLSEARNFAGCMSLFTALDEAESLVGSRVVEPSVLHRVARGLAHADLGEYIHAIAEYTRIIQTDPEYAFAYTRRGDAYAEMDDHQKAIADYTKAIEIDPEKAYVYTRRGNAYAERDDHQRAIADYTKAIETDPEDAYAYTRRGNAYAERDDHQRAIADYTKAIETDPEDAYAYTRRGDAYAEMDDHQQAIADYTKAIETDPEYTYAYTRRGDAYAEMDDHQQAIADYTKAIETDPEYTYAYTLRGNAYAEMDDHQQAIADYTKAIETDPEYTYAYIQRGHLFVEMERFEEAIVDFEALTQLDRKWLDTIGVNYGLALSYIGRYERAIAVNRGYLSRKPDEYAAHYNLAVAIARWKGITEATSEISKARERLESILDGENRADALYGLGGLEAIAGNNEAALANLEESASMPISSARKWASHDVAWLDLHTNPDFRRIVFGDPQ